MRWQQFVGYFNDHISFGKTNLVFLKDEPCILRAIFLKRHGDMGSLLIVGTP